MVIPSWLKVVKVFSPYLLRIKGSILAIPELLLASSPLFVLLSRLWYWYYCYHWQCSHKAAPHWVSRYRVEGQCWLFRNRWVPTSGNHSWRSEGWYHPTRSYCSSQQVSSILLCAPCVAKSVTLELTGSQVISQPYIDMMIATKTFGVDFSKDWLLTAEQQWTLG